MTHDRRKNDVTLRQHDICCFENNFLQTKVLAGSLTISKCSHLVRQLPGICRASVIPIMGNCLKGSGQDDISLLHDEESTDSPTTGEPPPPYQVQKPSNRLSRLIIFVIISSHLWRFFITGGSANLYTKSTCSSPPIRGTTDTLSSTFRPDTASPCGKIRRIEREKERVCESAYVLK